MKNLRIKTLALVLATFGLGVNAQTTFEEISADLNRLVVFIWLILRWKPSRLLPLRVISLSM